MAKSPRYLTRLALGVVVGPLQHAAMRVGFAGLGLMGEPMAANMRRAGMGLMVYNRSAPAALRLEAMGARRADAPDALFSACDAVILMLADDAATDSVLDRGSDRFAPRVCVAG